jgi:hypothetical protein
MTKQLGRRTRWIAAAALTALSLTASSAGAQDAVATSLDQMKMLVRAGDTVTITDGASGRRTTGQLADFSDATVGVLVDGTRHEIGFADVATIHQRRSASLGKGAKIGFGMGALFGAFGALGLVGECNHNCGAAVPFIVAAVLGEGAFGAGVGVGVAAITKHDQLVYTRPASSARLTVSPFATQSRRGVAVSLGF